MKNILKLFSLAVLFPFFVSCLSSVENGPTVIPEANIDFFIGDSDALFNTYADSLFPHPFTITALSRSQDTLNIEVTYGGGEGGCPTHLFILQSDNIDDQSLTDSSFVNLGLAHFLPTEYNCEALVEEKLEFNLREILGDQLSDSLGFRVTNLVDSTQVEWTP